MAGQSNAAPVIIKRKKIVQGGGHHGGAWKVAYADFVTAMMAFFMLMWLLNATTEKQRKGIADYFNPTIPVNRISGGGDGAFGGESIFSEQTLTKSGTGASNDHPTDEAQARGDSGAVEGAGVAAVEAQTIAAVEQALAGRSGESMTMERLMRHVVTRVTDEGLVIELFDLPEVPLFEGDSLLLTENQIAVNGHVRTYPITMKDNPGWDLSAARAQTMRTLLEASGVPTDRVARISGHSNRRPVTADPAAVRNNRIEIVLLRRDR
jgi:chemotaxis protein MotB